MTYQLFIDKFIHPFIIYVVIGTLISYLIAVITVRFPAYRDSKSRSMIFSIPFVVPFLAYLLYKPFAALECFLTGKPLGTFSDWLCSVGLAVATILTPLFTVVAIFAVTKAGLSIYASRRLVRKNGYAGPEDYPELFVVIADLCSKGGHDIPRIVVTRDAFARSFTMGYRSPVIVLSEGLLNALDRHELETVVAHELGHINRADSVITWFTVFLRDLMFFTPLSFMIFRDLSAEKEKAADDYAIKLTDKPMAFAHALIKVWRLSPRTFFANIMLDNFMPHPNLVGQAGVLEYRVKRILNDEHQTRHVSWFSYIAVIFITLISVALLSLFC